MLHYLTAHTLASCEGSNVFCYVFEKFLPPVSAKPINADRLIMPAKADEILLGI